MYIVLFFVVLCIIYVGSFKEDFTKEQVQKVSLALSIMAILLFILGIMGSCSNGSLMR